MHLAWDTILLYVIIGCFYSCFSCFLLNNESICLMRSVGVGVEGWFLQFEGEGTFQGWGQWKKDEKKGFFYMVVSVFFVFFPKYFFLWDFFSKYFEWRGSFETAVSAEGPVLAVIFFWIDYFLKDYAFNLRWLVVILKAWFGAEYTIFGWIYNIWLNILYLVEYTIFVWFGAEYTIIVWFGAVL